MTTLPPAGYWPFKIASGIRVAAARAPAKTALLCEGTAYTYRELADRVARIANLAQSGWGLGIGDVVALIAPNCADYLPIVCGLTDAGITVATVNPRLTAGEVDEILADCRPRRVIVHPALPHTEPLGALHGSTLVRIGSELDAAIDRASARFEPVALPEWAPFLIAYTSGTTGKPKGVLISHRSRVLTFHAMAVDYGCFGPDDTFLLTVPLCHGAGISYGLAPLFFGGTLVVDTGGFDAERTLSTLGGVPFTGTFVVPTQLHQISALPEPVLARWGGTHRLRTIISNAAALPQPLKERTIAYFGDGLLHETYGSTEAGIVTNNRPADQLRKRNCVGPVFQNTEVQLRDELGAEVAAGEVGELFSRSPYLFNGYLDRPEETAATLIDGWVTVGDLARRDEEGFLYIVDRKKDLIVSGGVNIYPREVENVIAAVVGVGEVAVVGLPDERWGESVHAFVVPDGAADGLEEAIVSACRDRLAGFKAPRGVTLVDSLPRNVGGKVLKTELRRRVAARSLV